MKKNNSNYNSMEAVVVKARMNKQKKKTVKIK